MRFTGRHLRITVLLVVADVAALGGCYNHVVGVSGGAGHDRRVIHEPNLDPDERVPLVDDLEDAVLGKRR